MVLEFLANRIAAACDRQLSLEQLVERSLAVPAPIAPWPLWTLLSLVKHRRRQEFVANAIRYQLNGDLGLIADRGYFGHPPGDQRGLVPGNVDWEYCFHGVGCCLTNRHTAEFIDVDFFDDTADLRRTDPDGEHPRPSEWLRCMEMLFSLGQPSEELIRRLSNAGPGCCAEAAVLALEHDLDSALDLFRQALRSRVPNTRTVASAVLAILDQPWSRRELAKVLEESDEQGPTADCRAALMETHSVDSHELVRRWEERNPHEPEAEESIAKAMIRRAPEYVRCWMEDWHDRVLPLRRVEPRQRRQR